MMNRSFLLERSHDVRTVTNKSWYYNHQLEVNTIFIGEKSMLACTASTMITMSKTDAAPGDDDPDPDTEFMY